MSLLFKAHPYQTMVRDHILDVPRCAIWAGMGLGKSVSTLNAIDMLMTTEDITVLVVAPLRVAKTVWVEEVAKWDHLASMTVSAIVGNKAERLAAIAKPASIYTTNFEQLPWLVEHWGDAWPYNMVVVDESTKLKGFRTRQGTQRAQALASVAHTKVDRIVLLTGTPCSNGVQDLWAQQYFVDQGLRLGRSFHAFSQRWFRPDHSGFGIIPLPHAQREIQDLLRDVCLTIDAKDWFDLTAPIVNNVVVTLPAPAMKLYKDMEKSMFMELESGDEVEAFGAAAKTIKCLQLCIAEGTEVMTDRGWKPIEQVTSSDLVWDGYEWSTCSGVAHQGLQIVIKCWGVRMTGGHRVLTNQGWFSAKEINDGYASKRFNRSDFRLPVSYSENPNGERRGWETSAPDVCATYDILNVGLRNQFVVRNSDGWEFIVHNCNGAAYVGESGEWVEIHDAKLQALDEIVEEAGGSPVLCAYHFKSDLARLKKAFPKGCDLATDQGMKDFKSGAFALGFGHAASIGHGVDGLQIHCHTIAFFGHWWDLEQRLQFIERVGPVRQMQAGKNTPVFIHNIIAKGTVDEIVLARIESKRSVQDLLLEAMKRRAT